MQTINAGCLKILVTANNSTNDNVVFFFYFRFENSILKQLLIFDHNLLDKREKYFRHYLFGDKIIQNCLKVNTTY